MDDERTAFVQRSRRKIFFEHKDMDYYLSWIIGREFTGGSLREDCMNVAEKITDGDYISWQREWLNLAKETESRAIHELGHGNNEQARDAYLRACTYYRAPLFMMSPNDNHFPILAEKMRSCFRIAAEFFIPEIDCVSVPYSNSTLSGYLWRPDEAEMKNGTLIVVGGIETFAEDCYFMIGQRGVDEPYNLIAVDLPGQGMNPFQQLFLEAKSEKPIKAIIDYLNTRNDIDNKSFYMFGFSWGGHIVLRGAQFEPRIKALIANPATINIFSSALAQQGDHGRNDPIGRVVFEQIAWRFGVNLGQTFRRLVRGISFLRYARVNPKKIECPTLCMAGESEAEITLKQTTQCFEQLPNSLKRLAIFSEEDGGAAHCQIDNLPLLHRTIFDWLQDITS